MRVLPWVEAAFAASLALLAGLAVAALLPRAHPVLAVSLFSPELLARADLYRRVGYLAYALAAALPLVALFALAVVARGPAVASARLGRAWLAAGLYALALSLALSALGAPLAWFRGLDWPRRFGLSTRTTAGFWADFAKESLIGAAWTAVAVAVLFALASRMPRRFFIPAGALAAAGVAALSLAGPVVLDPLFYRFTPLPDSPLRAELLALAEAARVPVGQVLVADASRRTTSVNAYVAGWGPTRRLVLYDTLLARYDEDEVLLVAAHEIAHVRYRHVEKGLSLAAAGAALGVGALSFVLRRLAAEGSAPALPHPGAVPWVLLLATLASLLVMPIENGISRRFEAEADALSLRLAPHPEAAVRLEVDLARTNLADADPWPYVEWFLFDHPSQLERARAALAAAGSRPGR
ncbi:MAG: M48 family metalloprotease [Clostridia bacterium]|nr:M48 family metalloprotease [Clostridia bacterium]